MNLDQKKVEATFSESMSLKQKDIQRGKEVMDTEGGCQKQNIDPSQQKSFFGSKKYQAPVFGKTAAEGDEIC